MYRRGRVMKGKIRDLEGEINGLRAEIRRINGKMTDLLDVLHDMRRKYSVILDISENEFLDLERIK
tara:strand:+ start:2857 stop:3054 length:198 start_codon:yes stop_codon:yes gene_type:complete